MTIEALAAAVLDACQVAGVGHMLTGAFATSVYGIPRSTKDVDVVLGVGGADAFEKVTAELESLVTFDPQIQFDTLTWGRRLVGTARTPPPFKVELYELFDDSFVQEQFRRRRKLYSEQIQRETWLPTPEDVIVQKLRWGRSKDLDDARDVIAVQTPEALDMAYVEGWCERHGTKERLFKVLGEIPPM